MYYLVPSVLANAFPLITMPFLTRILTSEDFGRIAIAQVVGLFVFGLANLGLPLIYERNYFQYKADPRKSAGLLWGCIAVILGLGLLFSLVSLGAKSLIEEHLFKSESPPPFLFLACITAVVRGASQIGYQYLRNAERAKTFALLSTLEAVVGFTLTMVFVVALRVGALGVILAQCFAAAWAFLFVSFRVRSELPFAWNGPVLREAISTGLPLVSRTFIGLLSGQLDKFLLGLISALGAVGIYSIGQRIAQVVYLLMNSMDYVFIPQTYKLMFEAQESVDPVKRAGLASRAGEYLTPFFYASTGVCLLVALFSEEVLLILTPNSFHGAIEIAAILCLFYSTLFFGKVNGRQMIFGKRVFISSFTALVSIAVNLAIGIPMVKEFGAVGAAWGIFLSNLVVATMSQYQAQNAFRIIWETKKIIAIFFVLALAVGSHIALLHEDIAYAYRLPLKVLGVFIYLGLGNRNGYLTVARLREMLSRKSLSVP